jgi:bHLH factor
MSLCQLLTYGVVERRRRETINEGINELAKIVPGCEKNKGSILQRAVQYIGQLKEAETTNLEKWTLEKLLLDQAINELSQTCDRLKADYQKAWEEKDAYKRACEENGLTVEIKTREGSPAPAPDS